MFTQDILNGVDKMSKIVYNACYGGFGMSQKAIDRYWELKGEPERLAWWPDDVDRADPILVQVVEELGEEAGSSAAELCIRELKPGTKWRLQEYDGMEWVETEDHIQWRVA